MREYQLSWKQMRNNSSHVNEIAMMKIGNLFKKNALWVDDTQ